MALGTMNDNIGLVNTAFVQTFFFPQNLDVDLDF